MLARYPDPAERRGTFRTPFMKSEFMTASYSFTRVIKQYFPRLL